MGHLLRSHTITVQNRQAALRHSPLLHARDDGGAENCTRRSSTVLPFLFGPRGGFRSEFGQFANLSDSRLRYFFGVAAAEPVFSRTSYDGVEKKLVP